MRLTACVASIVLLAVLGGIGVVACGGKKSAIAELTSSEGPVERQANNETTWATVNAGQEYYLGDAARTGDGAAQLTLIGGGAQIAMQKHTVLRFGGKSGQSRISVELGAIDLSGTGSYNLDIGDVKLAKNGKVRITARGGSGKAEIKLTLGEAQLTSLTGQTVDLVLDVGVEIGQADVKPLVDAGVQDAGVAEIDAPPPPSGGAKVAATGKKVELLLPGETKWTAVEDGSEADLPKGSKVRVGRRSTAKLIDAGTTLSLGGGSRASFTDSSVLAMEAGSGTLSATEGSVNLPGGAIAVKAGKDPSQIRIDTARGGMKVSITRGGARLTGIGGSLLDMNRGEIATLLRNGQIRPLEAIPTYFDMRITAGSGNFTIHDPRPPTAVQFQFAGKCPEGGIIEMDRDPRFRTAKVSAGKDFANHLVKGGAWHYRLRCSSGGAEGNAVASGRIAVIADSGSRRLPAKPGASPFTPNGMNWKIGYQSVIPDLSVTFPGANGNLVLHLARGGKDVTFKSATTKLKISGKELSEGAYTYWFDRDGVKQDKTGTLKIEFDQTAPQVYIELPINGRPWTGDIDVKGAVLPGWTAAVDTASIPIDRARRFIAKVGQPPGKALAIKLSHPQRGVHYYLRRGGK